MPSIYPPYNMADFGGSYDTVHGKFPRTIVDAIFANADANERPRVLDLGVYLVESGHTLNPFVEAHYQDGEIAGAQGEDSWGIGQINTRVPGRLAGPAYLGLDGLKRAMALMNGQWNGAFASLGGWEVWLSDVYAFQARFHSRAQGSIALALDAAKVAFGRAWLIHEVWRDAQAGKPAPCPECPPMSDAWVLRVGIAQIALDTALDATGAAGRLRALLDSVGETSASPSATSSG